MIHQSYPVMQLSRSKPVTSRNIPQFCPFPSLKFPAPTKLRYFQDGPKFVGGGGAHTFISPVDGLKLSKENLAQVAVSYLLKRTDTRGGTVDIRLVPRRLKEPTAPYCAILRHTASCCIAACYDFRFLHNFTHLATFAQS